MAFIIHYYNGSPISHRAVSGTLTVGRGEGHDLRIDDATVSSDHARFRLLADGGVEIQDMGSTNGVWYRGRRVEAQRLRDGDYVMVGTHDLQFVDALPEPLQRTAKIKKSWIPGVFYTES